MRKNNIFSCMLIIAITCMAGVATATPTISFSPSSVTMASDGTTEVAVILSDAPEGITGYQMTINFPYSVAKVSSANFPSWADMNRNTPGSTNFRISGIDLNKQVEAGSTNIELATITVTGVAAGTGTMTISNPEIATDADTALVPSLGTLSVKVTSSSSTNPTTTTTTITTTTTTAATTTTTADATTTVTTAETTAPVVTATTSTVKGMPVAGFTAKPGYGKPPLTVQFFDRSAGSPISWEWDFGDGGTSLAQNPTYSYQQEGTYTVTLRVTNTIGSSKVSRESYIIASNTNVPLPATMEPVTEESTAMTTMTTKVPVTAETLPTAVPTTTAKAPLEPVVSVLGIGTVLVGNALYSRRRDR